MLRRLTLGLFTLACAAAVVACSSGNTTIPSSGGQPGIGPNPATNTVYVADTTQNAIYLYSPSPAPSASPSYQIGGANTTMSGPSYLAFDSSKRLFVTNYNPATKGASILVFQTYAIGDVLPFGSITLGTGAQPHGIAMLPNNAGYAVAFTSPGAVFTSFINTYSALAGQTSSVTNTIAGSNTNLMSPIGVAVDGNGNLYAANSAGHNVTVYALPSPTPTPSGSPSPTPSPTPTATASGSPAPTPTPTPSSLNIAPTTTIACACFKTPTGLALDGSGNVYVTDPGSKAVYEFGASQIAAGTLSLTPVRTLTAPAMANPVDVKVDSAGAAYVVDSGASPNAGMLFIFPANATSPSTAIALPAGSFTGLALSP